MNKKKLIFTVLVAIVSYGIFYLLAGLTLKPFNINLDFMDNKYIFWGLVIIMFYALFRELFIFGGILEFLEKRRKNKKKE